VTASTGVVDYIRDQTRPALTAVGVLSNERTGVSKSLAVLEAFSAASSDMRAELEPSFEDRVIAPLLDRTLAQAEPVSYFVSRGAITATRARGMARWRKQLFISMSHNAANPTARFGLPPDRTVTMGSDITI